MIQFWVVKIWLVCGLLLSVLGCGKSNSSAPTKPPPDSGIKTPYGNIKQVGNNRWSIENAQVPPIDEEDTGTRGGGCGGGGSKGQGGSKKFGPSTFYLDGEPIAVVVWPELPPWLKTSSDNVGEGDEAKTVHRFVFGEYLTALGIPVKRVKAVHFFGGRGRVAVGSGENLQKTAQTLLFSFTGGENGKMRMHWRDDFPVSDQIDKVNAVQVYVEKEPPVWDRGKWALLDKDGNPVSGIPYATGDLRGGLRVYFDGRVIASFRRKDLEDKPTLLTDLLASHKLNRKIEAADVIFRDQILGRFENNSWKKNFPAITLQAGADGQSPFHFLLGDRNVECTALALYSAGRSRDDHRRQNVPRW